MPSTPKTVTTDLVDAIKETVAELTADALTDYKLCRYADVRLEVTEEKQAGAENGTPKYSSEATSGLPVTIKPENNELPPFQLTK